MMSTRSAPSLMRGRQSQSSVKKGLAFRDEVGQLYPSLSGNGIAACAREEVGDVCFSYVFEN